MNPNIIIIGIGHPDRGDDALGALAVDRLQPLLPSHIHTKKCLGDLTAIIEDFGSYSQVILIDAIKSNHPPGFLHYFTPKNITCAPRQNHASSHAFDLQQTLELSKHLGVDTNHIHLYGIEAKQFDYGKGLSQEVTQQMDNLISMIIKNLNIKEA